MSDFERIKAIMEWRKLTLNGLAKELNLKTSQTFYDIKNGKHGISKDLAEIITDKYLNINYKWLMTGEQHMFFNDDENIDDNGIPYYDMPVSGGALGVIDCGKELPVSKIKLPIFEGCIAIFPVIGVSMKPIINNGDYIGVADISQPFNWEYLNTSRIYLIITPNERMIKYISDVSNPDYIICGSENNAPFKVYKEDIKQIFQVRAVARML